MKPNSAMKSADQMSPVRDAAMNELRRQLEAAAREFERVTGQAMTRMEAYRKGQDWEIQLWTVASVRAIDGKIFT